MVLINVKKNEILQKLQENGVEVSIKVLKQRFIPRGEQLIKHLSNDLLEKLANNIEVSPPGTRPFVVKYGKTLFKGFVAMENLDFRFSFLKKEDTALSKIYDECSRLFEKDAIESSEIFRVKDKDLKKELKKQFNKRKATFNRVIKSYKLYGENFEQTLNSFDYFVRSNNFFVEKKVPDPLRNFIWINGFFEGVQTNLKPLFLEIFNVFLEKQENKQILVVYADFFKMKKKQAKEEIFHYLVVEILRVENRKYLSTIRENFSKVQKKTNASQKLFEKALLFKKIYDKSLEK